MLGSPPAPGIIYTKTLSATFTSMETTNFTFINIGDLFDTLMPDWLETYRYYEAYQMVREWVENNNAVMYEHEKYHFSRREAEELAQAVGVTTIVVHDCS